MRLIKLARLREPTAKKVKRIIKRKFSTCTPARKGGELV